MTIAVSIQRPDICPECGGTAVQTECDIVCGVCGLVLSRISVDSSYSLNEPDSDRRITQYASLGNRVAIEGSLGSFIQPPDAEWRRRLNHHAVKQRDDERLYRAFRLLNRLTGNLNIPMSTRDRAAALIRRFLPRMKNSTVIVNVCLVRACREHGVYLKEKDLQVFLPVQFSRQFKIRKARRNRAMSVLIEELGPVPLPQPINYLSMIIANLEKFGIEPEYTALIQTEARSILTTTKLPGHSLDYHVFAASCLYYVDTIHKHRLSQKAIGEASGISEYTIRDYYQKHWKNLKEVKERQKL